MLRRFLAGDAWVRATFALLLAHLAFVGIVQARPGLSAVLLWYVAPVLLVLAAAVLLAAALVRSWRRREVPTSRQLAGFAALAVVVGSLALFRTYPSSHDQTPSDVRFRLPLDGPVTVVWGGPTLAVNYHATMPDQRWAFDLLVTHDGRTFHNDGLKLEDYYTYGRPVLAPAAGTVRVAQNDQPDQPLGQSHLLSGAGNYVVLEVAPREFLFIAHMQPGSVAVAPGYRVSAGDVIGRVGNSGNSSEPHVHLHLQDSPRLHLGEGIPFYFHGYRLRGLEIERGMPVGGRERRRRRSPEILVGDIVEHIAQARHL
jgi:murein DD-endopeptidase MepM/ murein hydrolase activator NlpD